MPIVATGTLGPEEEFALSFTIGGVLRRLSVDDGGTVRAGDTLAALDLREIDAAVTRARSGAEQAERDLARARRLYDDSVATLSQVENAETAARVANANLEEAQFSRQYAVIVAPVHGTVWRRLVEAGEVIQPGAPVLVMGSRNEGTVIRVGLADRDVLRVQLGDSARVQLHALPERAFEGVVTEIAAAAAPGMGTYAVEVTVRGAGDLAAGLVGVVEIRPRRGLPTPIVPIEALLEADGTQGTVFALSADGRTVGRRQVTLASLAGDRIAITQGLEGVQMVVTDGAAYLADGDSVRIVP
jgi:RND family efflux transporter MFP subunit